MSDIVELSPDELLTTTRAVRRRLEFDRPVPLEVIKDCVRIALQAPSGSNRQGWHWIVITDSDQRARIADLYRAAFAEYRASATHGGDLSASDGQHSSTQKRVAGSVEYLAHHLHRVPVLLLACISAPGSAVLPDASTASMWGSLFPAVWSTVWTDLHLRHEQQVAEILDLPNGIRQGPLIPTAYTVGPNFRAGPRAPLDEVLHLNRW